VQGSVEVIAEDLQRMSTEKVRVRVLHSGVAHHGVGRAAGVGLERGDHRVQRRPDRKSTEVAERENVENPAALDHLRTARRDHQGMYGLLEPVFKENYAAKAEVTNVFKITKWGRSGLPRDDGV